MQIKPIDISEQLKFLKLFSKKFINTPLPFKIDEKFYEEIILEMIRERMKEKISEKFGKILQIAESIQDDLNVHTLENHSDEKLTIFYERLYAELSEQAYGYTLGVSNGVMFLRNVLKRLPNDNN